MSVALLVAAALAVAANACGQAAQAAADVKGKLDGQVAATQTNLRSAEARLGT